MTSTPIEHTPLTKYSNKAVINLCELGEMCSKLAFFGHGIEQNRSDKKELQERKIGEKRKQNRLIPNNDLFHHTLPFRQCNTEELCCILCSLIPRQIPNHIDDYPLKIQNVIHKLQHAQ